MKKPRTHLTQDTFKLTEEEQFLIVSALFAKRSQLKDAVDSGFYQGEEVRSVGREIRDLARLAKKLGCHL